ncbi:MAG: hypothetical protein OHK93_007785 [Ramalina farinacea]|uniref:Small ribosomal subunit protein mS38 n=1 Tax=Ramalina farinacea TaxID=258253 RepID=A0AA43QQF1_9LECA|nr:hypothetical protein [Ramalina farinacea]
MLKSCSDIHVASFFSQHRPISVSQVIPPATTTEAFSSLFNPAKPAPKSKAQDVIYTLSSAVDTLDQAVASQQDGQPQQQQQNQTPEELDLRAAVAQAQSQASTNSPETQHLDNLPAKSLHINLQELAKNFRPFVPPPPPVPMGALREASGRKRAAAGREQSQQQQQQQTPQTTDQQQQQQPTKQTTWTSTLTVYESTHADGRKTYKTYATPITRMPTSPSSIKELRPQGSQEVDAEHDSLQHQQHQQEIRYLPPASTLQPFLSRMQARQLSYADRLDARFGRMRLQEEGEEEGGGMQAISVKRQRKLKMKKHKYKKLMKRTKNLRRRLDKT